MATYVNDLRLKEIATGDEAGTWGTSTNTNLELIAEAFSFGTEAITTNADTHTTTIADGSTDPGRSIYLKYTGTLDSACTITIGPNTVSKLWFIENGTSGSQNIIISQGSGANVTVPAGEVKAIYSDGAGSGAAMVDAFAGLKVSDAAQTNITSLGTLTTLTVDDITINGSTISDSGDLTLDIGGDIILDADGGNVTFKDGGTAIGDLVNSSSDFVIESKVQDKDIIFKGDDGGSGITALTLDMSEAGKATFNSDIVFGGTGTITSATNSLKALNTGDNGFLIRSAVSSAANPSYSNVDDTNTGIFLPGSDVIGLTTGGSERMRIDSSGNLLLGATSTNTGGFGSISPQLLVSGTMPQVALHETDNDKDGYIGIQGSTMFIQTADAIPMRFATSDTERMRIASNGSIGFGTTPPTDTHTVWTQLFAGTRASLISENTTGAGGLDGTWLTDNMYVDSDTGAFANITTDESSAINQNGGEIKFFSQASGSAGAAITLSEKMRIGSSGNVSIGTTTSTAPFNVQADGSARGIRILGRNNGTSDEAALTFADNDNNTTVDIITVGNALTFFQGGTETIRFNDSGHLVLQEGRGIFADTGRTGDVQITGSFTNVLNFNSIGGSTAGTGFYLVTAVRTGASVGTHIVLLVGVSTSSLAVIYATLASATMAAEFSNDTLRLRETNGATINVHVTAVPIGITGND
jgi:hypothetical protein